MKKITYSQTTNHYIAIIALSLFSASVVAEETQPTSISQLSIQVKGISLQLYKMQQQINTLFAQPHLAASNNNKYVLPTDNNKKSGRNHVRSN
ncbi:MAG: hypothetical protein GQ547_03650 [Methylophaga sp.]|nr:hypothetical protein [Methylophaga sp.]